MLPEEIKMTGDGRLLGPGVSDNGAGLAALLALAAAWSAAPPLRGYAAGPVLVANVGEEGEGNLSGMRYLCRPASGTRLRAFLVLDGPSTEHITCQALASRRFDVTITGPGGHSWSDYGIGNPVHALSRAITLFTDEAAERCKPARSAIVLQFRRDRGRIEHQLDPERSARQGGPALGERRSGSIAWPRCSPRRRAGHRNRKRAQRSGGRVSGRVKEIGSRPGGGLRRDAPILECLRAVDAHLGIRSHLDCSSTDANIPLSLGMPAVSIGAGGQGGGAHTAAEWFQPEGRELGLRRILLALVCC